MDIYMGLSEPRNCLAREVFLYIISSLQRRRRANDRFRVWRIAPMMRLNEGPNPVRKFTVSDRLIRNPELLDLLRWHRDSTASALGTSLRREALVRRQEHSLPR